jgi:hypothetical protein
LSGTLVEISVVAAVDSNYIKHRQWQRQEVASHQLSLAIVEVQKRPSKEKASPTKSSKRQSTCLKPMKRGNLRAKARRRPSWGMLLRV